MGKSIATRIATRPVAGALMGQALAFVGQVVTAIKDRRQLTDLADCDDHQLSDIGITRDDLQIALSEPLWPDPTRALARRARTRSPGNEDQETAAPTRRTPIGAPRGNADAGRTGGAGRSCRGIWSGAATRVRRVCTVASRA